MAAQPEPFDDTQSRTISEVLKAVGHPIRLRIVDELARKERNVGELAEILGEKQAIVSQQLKILRMVALVQTERREGKSYYSLANPHLVDLLGCMRRCVCFEDR
ncbi:MAG: metalloregulator ArsR/SmtB family transcription factor [Deltaproteobacteria bacterium]|nr:metalloregulator ArsR/SmtB family transcription factor [Deltaproteobacteria bacterium]